MGKTISCAAVAKTLQMVFEAFTLQISVLVIVFAIEALTACHNDSVTSPGRTRDIPIYEDKTIGSPKGMVTASRIFVGPNQYPPMEFAAYGILAFRSRSSPHDRDHHMMFCDAYVATLPSTSELEVPRSKQMVTVWPVNSDEYSNQLNQLVDYPRDICQIAVDHYGLVIAQQAIKDAELAAKNLTGSGPFLLAWSPATDKGKEGVLVLVSDLSDITTYEQARERVEAWSRDIERDPTVWTKGWNRERLRIAIRDWVDKYGARSLVVFGMKR